MRASLGARPKLISFRNQRSVAVIFSKNLLNSFRKELDQAAVIETLIMSGQLPQFNSHLSIARVGIYPIQTREARHSVRNSAG
jgi:hypothetical protein